MVTTAFLGAYGYGNLGDELCLIEAMQAFPSDRNFAFSVRPEWTQRCVPGLDGCFRDGGAMLALRPDRVVFGGGMFGVTPAFQTWMPFLAQAGAAGAEIHMHNLGVGWLMNDLGWLDDTARAVIANLAGFTVRDAHAVERVAAAGFGRLPRITHFPETAIAPDFDLADRLLPRGAPLLGISIIPLPTMRAALVQDAEIIRGVLAEFAGWTVVPVVSTVHVSSPAEDDMAGVEDFLRAFLPEARIAHPSLLDRDAWQEEMTPRRLKGLIARCDVLISQRKHNVVHAIGTGVRVIGISPVEDNSLRRTFISLAQRLPPGSRCLGLRHDAS